jgi:hypothetical protein
MLDERQARDVAPREKGMGELAAEKGRRRR